MDFVAESVCIESSDLLLDFFFFWHQSLREALGWVSGPLGSDQVLLPTQCAIQN